MVNLICKGCKAEVTEEALNYAEDNEIWHSLSGHMEDCGCYEHNEDLDMEACACEFVRPSEIKKTSQ